MIGPLYSLRLPHDQDLGQPRVLIALTRHFADRFRPPFQVPDPMCDQHTAPPHYAYTRASVAIPTHPIAATNGLVEFIYWPYPASPKWIYSVACALQVVVFGENIIDSAEDLCTGLAYLHQVEVTAPTRSCSSVMAPFGEPCERPGSSSLQDGALCSRVSTPPSLYRRPTLSLTLTPFFPLSHPLADSATLLGIAPLVS